MNTTSRTFFASFLLSSALALVGCGSDSSSGSAGLSYSGSGAATEITAANAQAISTGSAKATTVAASADTANDNNPFAASISLIPGLDEKVSEITRAVAAETQSLNLPAAFSLTSEELNADPNFSAYFTACGGSVSGPDSGQGTFTYNNFCIDDIILGQIIMNGSLTITSTDTTSTTSFVNFSVTANGETFVINSTLTCTYSPSFSCASLFVGDDGKTHKYENEIVFSYVDGSYDVSATYYHPDYGSVTISTTGLTFSCPNGTPGPGGSIDIMAANSTSASITFNTCSTYTYCYDLGGGPVCGLGNR